MMKLKYLYILLLFVLIALLVVSSSLNNVSVNKTEVFAKQNLINENKSFTKDNVTQNTKHQLDILKKFVESHPDDTLKLREYADFLYAAHKPDEAIMNYEKILIADPRRTDILFQLSFIYYNKHYYKKAEEITRKILTIDNDNLQAVYNLGALAATNGDSDKAKEIWNKLVKEHPGTSTAILAKESLQRL